LPSKNAARIAAEQEIFSMRIGVTSQNFRTITAHAGRTRRFMIYEETPDGQIFQANMLDLPVEMSIHEFPRHAAHPIDGLDVLITGSCGDGFKRKLAARGIRVIVTSETDPIMAVAAVLKGADLPPASEEEEEDGHEGCGCNCAGGGNR
jgi:predicted Fe-Mo cluster-binding NifX family protein